MNKKLTDKPLVNTFAEDSVIHILEPNNLSQSATGSDFRIKLTDVVGSNFKQGYDIVSNIPALENGTGTLNTEYVLTTAGTRDFGAGNLTFGVDDIIAYNGAIWYKKVDNNQGGGIGYTAEDVYNKSDSYTVSSSTTYASTKALVDGLESLNVGTTPQLTITGNLTLDDTYNGAIVKVKSNATITIPSTLLTNFSCVFRCFTGTTATFVAGGGVTIDNPTGLILAPFKMATLFKDGSTATYILTGETKP